MKVFWILSVAFMILEKVSEGEAVDLTIPANLTIGSASAAYQVEGAWNMGGKGISVWDYWTHNRSEMIIDRATGDVACNSYYKYKEDVARMKSIGLESYRFSVSWSRVLPTGFTNVINEEGLQYYKNLTAELVANGIQPMVTLYHFDHPQILESFGGWTNEMMIDLFVDYARIVFEAIGDNVKVWTTLNEPNLFCAVGYDTNPVSLAPGKLLNGTGMYKCMHTALKAHALVYHMYDKEFRPTQHGKIGLSSVCDNFIPADASDTTSADIEYQFQCGWLNHPIYKGDYPAIMKTRIAEISAAQGYSRSRLPEFSDEWISLIKGTSDYFGLIHYSSTFVTPDPYAANLETFTGSDSGLMTIYNSSWPRTGILSYFVTPSGFRDILVKIRDEYGNPPVRVLENGYSDEDGEINDYNRISYFYGYMEALLRAIKEDGCNVLSYNIWTLIDDFEWNRGFSLKFGIVSVDFKDPERPRTDKLSASWWKSVLESRRLQPVPRDGAE